jgi:hypothetical protein
MCVVSASARVLCECCVVWCGVMWCARALVRSPNAAKPYILVPQQGSLWVQDGVLGHLRPLFDCTSTGLPGPALTPQVRCR